MKKTIATYMLLECWKDEAEHQMLDEYHWINDTGCLDVLKEDHKIWRP